MKLLERVRQALRLRHYSLRTEEAYLGWVRRFIRFHGTRHPSALGPPEVTQFLTSLAVDRSVSASTQNQALSALVFLYRDVLDAPVGWLAAVVRAKQPARVPVVLTRDEVRRVLGRLKGRGVPALVAGVLYGTGMRVLEALRLRAKDVDFAANEITVRGGKGDRDRVTMLPERLKGPLLHHLAEVRTQHERDLAAGAGWVELPGALGAKYPQAGREWAWQWVFPATRMYDERRSGQRRRHHLHESVCSGRFGRRCERPGSPSARVATPCATRSRRISSSPGMTFARYRSCSGIVTSLRP